MSNTTLKWAVLRLCPLLILVNIGCGQSVQESAKTAVKNTHATTRPRWASELIAAYRALNEQRSPETATLLVRASDDMPKKNWENYFMAAAIYAPNGLHDQAFESLEKAIGAGLKDYNLLTTYPELSSLKEDQRWSNLVSKVDSIQKGALAKIENPAILAALQNMWSQDQRALSQYEEKIKTLDSSATWESYQALFEPVEKQWDINRKKLDSIIAIHGWPGNRLVREDGAKLAWAISQHHPDVFYKQRCLALLKTAIEQSDADPNHYAELNDRIARETWQKQTYGASMGENAPYPIKNPEEVNKKRLELGLFEPIEVYALYHGIDYQLPSEEEIRSAYQQAQDDYKKFEAFLGTNMIDSVNTYLERAIAAHGDISDEQLYNASLRLAQLPNKRSQRITFKILKVLIWRKWDKRFQMLTQEELTSIHHQKEWEEIEALIKMSR